MDLNPGGQKLIIPPKKVREHKNVTGVCVKNHQNQNRGKF